MGLHACRLCVAITRGNCRWQEKSEFGALPRQHEGIAVSNDGGLFGHKVADAGGVKARSSFLQHEGTVPIGHGVFVVALGFLAFNDVPGEFIAGNLDLEAEQHCADWQRESVDRLYVCIAGVHIGLFNLHLCDKFMQAGSDIDPLERNLSVLAIPEDGYVLFTR